MKSDNKMRKTIKKSKSKKSKGGYRPGSGRKPGDFRVQLALRIKPHIYERLEQIQEELKMTKTDIIETAIENFQEK
jgi:hypothetical protein